MISGDCPFLDRLIFSKTTERATRSTRVSPVEGIGWVDWPKTHYLLGTMEEATCHLKGSKVASILLSIGRAGFRKNPFLFALFRWQNTLHIAVHSVYIRNILQCTELEDKTRTCSMKTIRDSLLFSHCSASSLCGGYLSQSKYIEISKQLVCK